MKAQSSAHSIKPFFIRGTSREFNVGIGFTELPPFLKEGWGGLLIQ